MNNEFELKVFLAAGRLETLEMERDQAEFEFLDTLCEALDAGLSADAVARAANMKAPELLARLTMHRSASQQPLHLLADDTVPFLPDWEASS